MELQSRGGIVHSKSPAVFVCFFFFVMIQILINLVI